jgi:1-phosphatidylinositol-3-phosphate 5-kinase
LNDSDDDDTDAYEEKLLSNTYERVAFSPRPTSPIKKARSSSVVAPTSSASSTPPGELGTSSNWTEIENEESYASNSSHSSTDAPPVVPQDGKGDPGSTEVVETDEQRPEKDAISRFRMQTQIRRKASMQTFAVPQSTPEKVSKQSKESGDNASSSATSSSEPNSKAIDQASNPSAFSSALASEGLNKEANAHLERICSYLIGEYGLNTCWQPIILSLAKSACVNLRPQWRYGDRIDICSHTKIKKIPGGSMDECSYVDGLVFTKNRSQKSMRTDIQSARVLLLGCSIEFERKERIVSFDKLLAQEREYLRMLVSKIASMQPDVILVEKSVSRVAQDLIRDAGICLAVNVKANVLQQIARISQSTILQSTEHVLTANIGVIGHFKIEAFNGPWGSKPIMYIAGCPRHLFASLIIRGAPDAVLTRVKSVLAFLVNASWNIKLENSLLTDEYATVKSGAEISNGPMSTSWSVTVPTATEKKSEVRTATKLGRKLSVSQGDDTTPVTTPRQTAAQPSSGSSSSAPDAYEQPTDTSSSALASELSQYLVGPTLLRTPLIPELCLSSSASARPEERSAHLALNFSYRSLLSPSPSLQDDSIRASRGPLAGTDSASKIATKMTFGDSSPVQKYERIIDQHIIYLHSLFSNVTSTQCTPFEWQIIHYYSQNDLTLGQFLETYCFSNRLKCSTPECHKSLMDHERSFMHHDGRLNVAVRPWPPNLPNPVGSNAGDSKSIYTWAYCRKHSRQTPFMVPMAPESLCFSFGKYLELYFYAARSQCQSCGQHLYREHIRYFYFENKVVIFAFEPVKALEVVVPPMRMKFDDRDSVALLDQELEDVIYLSQRIHERVMSKLTELEDSYLPTDAEERAEIQNFRKTQEKEKISFLEKLQKEQEKINTNQTNMFQLTALRRHLYGNVKTWNSMIMEHEIRYQKKRQSVSQARKDNSNNFPVATIAPEAATAAVSIGGLSVAATAVLSPAPVVKVLASSTDSVTNPVQGSADGEDKVPVVSVTAVEPSPVAVSPSTDGDSSSSSDSNRDNRRSTESLTPLDTTPAQQPATSPSVPVKDTKKAGTFLDAFSAFSEILPSKSKSSITDVMEDTKVHIFSSGSASHACTAIYENEPSSIIAFALNSEEYEAELKKFQPSKPAATFMEEAFRAITSPANTTISNEWKTSSIWGGPRIRLSCTTHFAQQFTWLRRLVGLSEERFTLSLSRCRSWLAQGGKSGSRFCKTMDGRFILKSIQPVELQGFLAFAPLYFDYFSKVFFQQVPTAIAKTVGIYSVFIKTGKKEEKFDFVVMENLFYGHNIEKTFDLKGSLRSRYATAKPGAPRDVVFMDEVRFPAT